MLTVTKYVLMQVIVPSFFFTTHADPLKAQLIMITEAVKVIRLLSQLKSTYVQCTLYTANVRRRFTGYTDRNFVAFSSQQVLHFDLEVKY